MNKIMRRNDGHKVMESYKSKKFNGLDQFSFGPIRCFVSFYFGREMKEIVRQTYDSIKFRISDKPMIHHCKSNWISSKFIQSLWLDLQMSMHFPKKE